VTRRLLIVDRYDAPALTEVVGGRHGDGWDVLLLGPSGAWYRWRHASGPQADDRWRIVDPAPFAARASDLVGDFLVQFMVRLPDLDLGGQTLARLLESSDGNLWWYLEVAEKGPYRGPLVGQLYQLALARLVIAQTPYNSVRVSLADAALAEVFEAAQQSIAGLEIVKTASSRPPRWWDEWPLVRYWVHAASAALNLLLVKLLIAGTRAPEVGRDALVCFTFYPAWWARPFSAAPDDRFFSDLAGAGARAYLAWIGSPLALWRHRRRVRKTLVSRRFVVLQSYVRLREAIALLGWRGAARARRFERRMRQAIAARFAGFDVGLLIGREISQSLTSGEPLQDVLLARAVRRAAAALRPRAVLYRLEFQPTENALVRGLAGLSASVGFLHYPFGRHYLPMRFAPGEVDRHLRRADRDRPLPDAVIACGAAGVEHFAESGYPRPRLAVCGPQRYGRLIEYRRRREPRERVRGRIGLPADVPVYLVALAIAQDDTEALFAALVEALGDRADYRLIVRTHPNRPQGDPGLRAALDALGSARASLMQPGQDLYDCLAAADAMICIGSMIAFEAMALGTMPIVFENPASFAALSLAEYEDGLFVVRDGRELGGALDAVQRDTGAAAAKRRSWPAVLERVLGDLETPLAGQLMRALGEAGVMPDAGRAIPQRTAVAL